MNRSGIVILLTFLLLIFSRYTPAQTLSLSADNIDKDGIEYARVLGYTRYGFYVLLSNLPIENFRSRSGFRIRRNEICFFDNNLKMMWKRAQDAYPESGNIDQVIQFNGDLICITRNTSKTKNELQFYFHRIDSRGEIKSKEKLLCTIPYSKSSEAESLSMILSPDKSQCGIVISEKSQEGVFIHTATIDTTFQIKAGMKIRAEETHEGSGIYESGILDNGDFYFVSGRSLKDESGKRNQNSSRSFRLYYLKNGESVPMSYPINGINEPMQGISVVFDKYNRSLIATGIYADKGSPTGAGILFAHLPVDSAGPLQRQSRPIVPGERNKITGRRNAGGGIGLHEYSIQGLYARSDGGAILITEGIYFSEYAFFDYFTQTYNRRIEYHFEDIVVFSVNADAGTDWIHVIDKDQRSMDDEGLYSSFIPFLLSDQISLIYGTNAGRNNEIKAVSIEPTGNVNVSRLKGLSENVMIMPRYGKQISSKAMVLPVFTRKKLFIGQIVF